MDRLVEMVRLHRSGIAHRKAAQMLRMGPNTHRTARDAFAAAGLWDGPADELPPPEALRALLPQRKPRQQVSSIESWRTQLEDLEDLGLNAKTIHDRLTLDDPSFKGSYDAVKRAVAALRSRRPISPEDVVIPVETAPGELAQVDFAYVGEVLEPVSGVRRKAWVFVMTLGYSRHFFARVVYDQSVPTWLDLHVRAFAFFRGVPRAIVPDNLKAAVIRVAFGVDEDIEVQRSYRDLARHYGFLIDPAPPRSPKKKGKVERNIQYVESFLESRRPDMDIDALNADLLRWNLEIAALRTHGTIRRVPQQVFDAEEQAALLPLPKQAWIPTIWREKRVHQDAHILFERRFYSVPWQHIGEQVWVQATPDRLFIRQDGRLLAEHARRGDVRSTIAGHLPTSREDWAKREPSYWQERSSKLGAEVGSWVAEQFAQDTVSRLRVVQAVVIWLETLPEGRADSVCRRAREFGIRKLAEIKSIARLGLDRQPDAPSATPLPGAMTYGRSLEHLFQNRMGVNDAWH